MKDVLEPKDAEPQESGGTTPSLPLPSSHTPSQQATAPCSAAWQSQPSNTQQHQTQLCVVLVRGPFGETLASLPSRGLLLNVRCLSWLAHSFLLCLEGCMRQGAWLLFCISLLAGVCKQPGPHVVVDLPVHLSCSLFIVILPPRVFQMPCELRLRVVQIYWSVRVVTCIPIVQPAHKRHVPIAASSPPHAMFMDLLFELCTTEGTLCAACQNK
eukprot:scaffold78001_cov19-Tisochrysis_lutea.AAC.1